MKSFARLSFRLLLALSLGLTVVQVKAVPLSTQHAPGSVDAFISKIDPPSETLSAIQRLNEKDSHDPTIFSD